MDMGWIADDDATYVAMAADVLETDSIDMVNPYTGAGTSLIYKRFLQSSLWIPAYLSTVSGISVATIIHTVQYEQMLLLAYTVYIYTAGELFSNRENRFIFLLFISIFFIFGYHSFYSLTIRMLGPNYHGKAILATSLSPLVLILLLRMLSIPYQRKAGILFAIVSIGYVALTLWGIGTCLVITIFPVLISLFSKNRNWKYLFYIFWGCSIPVSSLVCYFIYNNGI